MPDNYVLQLLLVLAIAIVLGLIVGVSCCYKLVRR